MYLKEKNIKFHFNNSHYIDPISYGPIRLIQIGDCCAKPDLEIEEHKQTCFEISYIVSGVGYFRNANKTFRVIRGDTFFSAKNDIHHIKTSNKIPVRFFYLGFELEKSSADFSSYQDLEDFFMNIDHPVLHEKFFLQGLFTNLINEIRQDFEKKDLLIKAYLEQLVLYTYKLYYYKDRTSYIDDFHSKEGIVYDIISYIDNNIQSITNLQDISDYIGFSYSYTLQLFSSIMKTSLGAYYQKVRLERAAELLLEGTSTSQVADIFGFDSVNSFSRSFKKYWNRSPKEFLKNKDKK